MTKRKFNFFENEAGCSNDDSESEEQPDDYDYNDSFIASDESLSSEDEASDDDDLIEEPVAENIDNPLKKKRGRPKKVIGAGFVILFIMHMKHLIYTLLHVISKGHHQKMNLTLPDVWQPVKNKQ